MSEAEQIRQQRQSKADSAAHYGGNEQGVADRIVYFHELKQRYGKSRTTIWRWVRDNHFPAPVRVGPNSVGWWESALLAFDQKIGGTAHVA